MATSIVRIGRRDRACGPFHDRGAERLQHLNACGSVAVARGHMSSGFEGGDMVQERVHVLKMDTTECIRPTSQHAPQCSDADEGVLM